MAAVLKQGRPSPAVEGLSTAADSSGAVLVGLVTLAALHACTDARETTEPTL